MKKSFKLHLAALVLGVAVPTAAFALEAGIREAPAKALASPSGLTRSIGTARYCIFLAMGTTSFVPDAVVAELCDALGLVGTPADCAARIVEMTRLGVRNLYLILNPEKLRHLPPGG